MNEVPAHTSPPINDHSLFDHAKLTTAIATCMYLSGGYRGNDVKRYRFTLLSGDVDKIQAFINMSRRLPDLIGGSLLVNRALSRATSVIGETLGFDCVIYEGGGGFLALIPPQMKEELKDKVTEAFLDETGGGLTITVSTVEVDGSELENFGAVWGKAIRNMRHLKMKRVKQFPTSLEPSDVPCDECGVRVAVYRDGNYLSSLNAQVKPDVLCETCWRRRMLGRSAATVRVDDIAGKDFHGFVAVLKMDGDHIGEILDGTRIEKELGKTMTPSRLSAISRLLHESSEALKGVVEKHGGECVYAGGDDVLAILPGLEGLRAACEIADEFKGKLESFTSMSAGVVLVKAKHPLYAALEVAQTLLKRAKDCGRNRIDYRIVVGTGYTSHDVHAGQDRFPNRPYEWDGFKQIMRDAEELDKLGLSLSQLRALMRISRDLKKAGSFLKRQVGRGIISYEDYERLLRLLQDNSFPDVYEIFMLSRR
ncbi:type III-B CRISPR-associated protein Cas10/Cmr2 [Candidatus Bathyarchaeota archaeon]|nr:MAG: type III-B CRISPR-associated protein Cas10/Cmr2 [Candidatus Bathyarchaeota archaeon]